MWSYIDTPLLPYVASGLSTGGEIIIGTNCWLSTAVTVTQSVSIGCGTVIGANSLVLSDIPPFSIAVGSPCKVTKRFNFEIGKWIDVEDWTVELEMLLPSEDEYLSVLLKSHKMISPSLIASGKRFGWL